jgi:TetR/AcrR family transcriptional regulator, transcriptional repressor for nem operon
MRYPKEHKEQVREHLLSASGGHAKKYGFDASGVGALAGAAGLTTGSLYKHFDNKDALFAALIKAELQRTVSRIADIKPGDIEAMLNSMSGYLSMSHVGLPEKGCLIPSLAADVARSGEEAHLAFEAGVCELQKTVESIVGSSSAAWTLIAQNVGAVMIARAMQQESIKLEILAAVQTAGAELLAMRESAVSTVSTTAVAY